MHRVLELLLMHQSFVRKLLLQRQQRDGDKGEFGTQGGNPIMYEYMIPLEFDEKTDIKIDVDNSSIAGCGATFDLLTTGH